jgi:hypothetical protein
MLRPRFIRSALATCALAAGCAAHTGRAYAQAGREAGRDARVVSSPATSVAGIPLRPVSAPAPPFAPARGEGRHDDVAFLASLALPGAGQYVLKQDRWLPYVAVETWAWLRYVQRRSNARRLSIEYKDLAWSTARRISVGERRDTTFPYYEVLLHFTASGAYDSQPAVPGLQPEFDRSTYNGEQWDLATKLFLPDGAPAEPGTPAYEAALQYYSTHAIPDQYAFAWNRDQLEQQVYENVINESDAAYRDATRMLGLILANHLTSAVDALISARLRAAGVNMRFESGLGPETMNVPISRAHTRDGPLQLRAQLRYRW